MDPNGYGTCTPKNGQSTPEPNPDPIQSSHRTPPLQKEKKGHPLSTSQRKRERETEIIDPAEHHVDANPWTTPEESDPVRRESRNYGRVSTTKKKKRAVSIVVRLVN